MPSKCKLTSLLRLCPQKAGIMLKANGHIVCYFCEFTVLTSCPVNSTTTLELLRCIPKFLKLEVIGIGWGEEGRLSTHINRVRKDHEVYKITLITNGT